MKIKELKAKDLKKQFQITIPSADFEKEVEVKIADVAKHSKIAGFRPGFACAAESS